MNTNDYSVGIQSSQAIDPGLRAHMVGTYNLLLMGLLISAATAWGAGQLGLFEAMVSETGGFSGFGYLMVFAPLIMLFGGMLTGLAATPAGSSILYWSFVAVNGVSLGFLTSHYTGGTVVTAALCTAIAFGGASIYGYTAKRNLSGMGTFMFMGLIGIIGAGILNLFLLSSALQFAISSIAVIVFSGLAAWETQRLKEMYHPGAPAGQMRMVRNMAALGFYLDVINIFQSLLWFLGDD